MAWQVPSWLQPPSEAERRQLEAMEEQVRAKATSMLRKNVGMARMQSEAARLVQTGMDESTARKKALLDNASLIFADNPEAVARIMQTEESNAIQERAAASLERWRNAQTEDRLRDSQFTPGFGTSINPETGKPEAFFQTSPSSGHLVKPKTEAKTTLPATDRLKLTNLYSQLRTVQAAIDKSRASKEEVTPQDQQVFADLQLRRARIERQIRELSGEEVAEPEKQPDPAAEPAKTGTKRFRWENGELKLLE